MTHVLIIEDEFLIADYLADLATFVGATSIDIAETEDEAIAMAEAEAPAIIVSDVRLRYGMGPVAVQKIRESVGDIPVIFVTGSPEDCPSIAQPAIILPKPFSTDVVIHNLKQSGAF